MENQESSNSQTSSLNSSQSNPEEIIESYMQEINNLNVAQYLSNAKELMDKGEYQNASFIYKAIIRN
jgi:predicted DNA-binding protein